MLERITSAKRREIEELSSLVYLEREVAKSPVPRLSRETLCHPSGRLQVIAEVKRASPVKGLLRNFTDPADLGLMYQEHGAAVISVISDQEFFDGRKEYVRSVSAALDVPVLRKDFILHEIQLYESRRLGARLVLLIAALHDYNSLLRLCENSVALGLEPLLEIHDEAEIELIKDLPIQIIGVNNRNLKTFEVDLGTSINMADLLDDTYIKVSESGIREPRDMALLEKSGYNAVLVGEALVTAPHPGQKLSQLLNYREVQE